MTANLNARCARDSLWELTQELGVEASSADLRSLYLGYLANEPIASPTMRSLHGTWAKVEYLLSLFDQRTAQLYFDAYRGLTGHLLWTYVPSSIDPGAWAGAVPLVGISAPNDQILVVSVAAKDEVLHLIRRDLQALSAQGKPVVYVRRRRRQMLLVRHSPQKPTNRTSVPRANPALRGGFLNLPAMREIVGLRIAEGQLMQAFSRYAGAGSSEHTGRIRTPLALEQFGLSTDSHGTVDGVVTWAWCHADNLQAFQDDPYSLHPALWREGDCLQIVDALGDWRRALRLAVEAGRLTEHDRGRLASCEPLTPRVAA